MQGFVSYSSSPSSQTVTFSIKHNRVLVLVAFSYLSGELESTLEPGRKTEREMKVNFNSLYINR